jgi:hypothetical protein
LAKPFSVVIAKDYIPVTTVIIIPLPSDFVANVPNGVYPLKGERDTGLPATIIPALERNGSVVVAPATTIED